MVGICVNCLDPFQFFRFLKGRCHGNQLCGKITYPLHLSLRNCARRVLDFCIGCELACSCSYLYNVTRNKTNMGILRKSWQWTRVKVNVLNAAKSCLLGATRHGIKQYLSQTMRSFIGLDPSPTATISRWDASVRIQLLTAAVFLSHCLLLSRMHFQFRFRFLAKTGWSLRCNFPIGRSRILLLVLAETEVTTYGPSLVTLIAVSRSDHSRPHTSTAAASFGRAKPHASPP